MGFSPTCSFSHWISANSTISCPSTIISTGAGSGAAAGRAIANADEMNANSIRVLLLNNILMKQ
jgi:hypothetical protein